MIDFIINNPMILLLVFLFLMMIMGRKLVTKTSSTKKSNVSKSETGGENNNSEDSESVLVSDDNLSGDNQNNAKKAKKKLRRFKPEIVRVYEKKEYHKKEENKQTDLNEKAEEEQELLKTMQFVKTTRKVSRLKPNVINDENNLENLIENFYSNDEILNESVDHYNTDNSELNHNSIKQEGSHYFDKSRRLSKIIKDGNFDNMFCSHISEKYMNMDAIQRHIRNCSEFQEKLYERASRTLANSQSKVSVDVDGKIKPLTDNYKSELENRKRQELAKMMIVSEEDDKTINEDDLIDNINDELNLSARNILIVDSILNRKGKKSVK